MAASDTTGRAENCIARRWPRIDTHSFIQSIDDGQSGIHVEEDTLKSSSLTAGEGEGGGVGVGKVPTNGPFLRQRSF